MFIALGCLTLSTGVKLVKQCCTRAVLHQLTQSQHRPLLILTVAFGCLIKVVAMVLEPTGDGTWLVVDGEVIPYQRLFAEVHPSLCNVLIA